MRILSIPFVALLMAAPSRAAAAESYDNCVGFIDALPATIATQGVWCLRRDLATPIASGNAITVTANNITIDCNDFMVDGRGAGLATHTTGIRATSRSNVVVRNCRIDGFHAGVYIDKGGGHVVEDNRFDGNPGIGVRLQSIDSVLRRNRITDTGGSTFEETFPRADWGIYVAEGVDVIDNVIVGVRSANPDSGGGGIYSINNFGATISGNRIRELEAAVPPTGHTAILDHTYWPNNITGNILFGSGSSNTAIHCSACLKTKNIYVGFRRLDPVGDNIHR